MGLFNKRENKEKDSKISKTLKKQMINFSIMVGLKIIPLLLIAAIITSIINWIVKIFESKNTITKIYEIMEIDDVYDLVQIKGNESDGYYFDFVDGIDSKLDYTIKYLNKNAGVKSITNKEFLKKVIKAEIYTQVPDLGGNIISSSGFQGAIDIVRITPDKEINTLVNTGAGQVTIIDKKENDKIELVNKDEIDKQESIIKGWSKGKELTLGANAFVYSQEDSKLNPGEKIDYWIPQKSEKTQEDLTILENEKVKYTGNYSISMNKLTEEGLIYIGIEKGNIKGYIKYSYILKDSKEENSDNVTNEEFENSGYVEQIEEKIVDTIDSNVYKLTYIPKEIFDEYMASANKSILNYFTLDDEGNLITVTWEAQNDGTLQFKNNSTINLKSALQNLVMPFEYLMYFYINADYEDFSNDLADEVFKSKIIVAIEDNITTSYAKETTEERKISQLSEYSYDWTQKDSVENVTEYCNTNVDIIYADTWCVKLVNKDIYNEELLNTKSDKPKNLKLPGKVTETTSNSISKETMTEKGNDEKEETETYEDSDGKKKKRKVTKKIPYKKYERILTYNHNISNSYASGNKEKEPESKENIFVDLYKKHKMYNRLSEKRLLKILERDSKTSNLVNLTKYLMYMATDTDFGVKEYDFSEYRDKVFNNVSSIGDSIPLYTSILDKETFIKALNDYANNSVNVNFKNNFLPYASDIYDWSIEAGVNPELVIITACAEQGFKAPSNAPNNYWGIAVYRQNSVGRGFSSLHEGINAFAEIVNSYKVGGKYESLIMNLYNRRKDSGCNPLGYGLPGTFCGMQSAYSAQDNITHAIGKTEYGNYLLNCVYRGSQSDYEKLCLNGGSEHDDSAVFTPWEAGEYTAWQVENKIELWNVFFGKYGNLLSVGNTDIIETGKSKLGCPYVLGAKGPDSFDCSGFVWWVYKQNGIDVPSSTDAYKSYKGSSKEISWEEAQPGDILLVFNTERGTTYGHAAIYLGEDSYMHAPQENDVVKIAEHGAKKYFNHVFRFY